MRLTSAFLRGAAVVLAVACGGKTVSQASASSRDAGRSESDDPGGSCFCESADAGVTAPFPSTDSGGADFGDAAGFDAGLAPCPAELPEAGLACPDHRLQECTYVTQTAPGRTCHRHCRCVVIPEAESWSCAPDVDCDQ